MSHSLAGTDVMFSYKKIARTDLWALFSCLEGFKTCGKLFFYTNDKKSGVLIGLSPLFSVFNYFKINNC